MERKKFEIIENAPKKKFEIISETSLKRKFEIKSKKRFEIKTQEGENITLEWFQQRNANDCGPCLILNGLRRIEGVQHIPDDISEVRREVNRLREERGRPELGPSDWFTSEDIGRYLSEIAGLNVEEYACFADVAEETERNIRNSLEERPFDMLYSTAGRHFRGVVPKEENFELLDSLQDAPTESTADSINNMVAGSVYAASRERVERLGIVRRGQPGYTVKSF